MSAGHVGVFERLTGQHAQVGGKWVDMRRKLYKKPNVHMQLRLWSPGIIDTADRGEGDCLHRPGPAGTPVFSQ